MPADDGPRSCAHRRSSAAGFPGWKSLLAAVPEDEGDEMAFETWHANTRTSAQPTKRIPHSLEDRTFSRKCQDLRSVNTVCDLIAPVSASHTAQRRGRSAARSLVVGCRRGRATAPGACRAICICRRRSSACRAQEQRRQRRPGRRRAATPASRCPSGFRAAGCSRRGSTCCLSCAFFMAAPKRPRLSNIDISSPLERCGGRSISCLPFDAG